jgi:predicted amidohydrolase
VSKISVAQVNPIKGDVEKNIGIVRARTAEAAAQGSELIVFPELMLTGLVTGNEAKLMAEKSTGDSVNKLIDLSMQHRIYIVAGMVEQDGDKFYNTAVLTGPEGLVGKHRKMHLCELDKDWATPGNLGFNHFNTPIGRIGILVGHDAMFPESGRLLALRGVDLICCPSAVNEPKPYGLDGTENWHNYPIPMGYSPMHWHLWRVRAGENNCYTAFANMICDYVVGDKCFGRSGIFQPDTFLFPREEKIMPEHEEGIITLTIDTSSAPGSVYPTNVVRRKDLVMMRKPLEYDVIVDENAPVYDFF